jgi:hypothetical protein
MDKVALRQGPPPKVLLFSPVSIISPVLHSFITVAIKSYQLTSLETHLKRCQPSAVLLRGGRGLRGSNPSLVTGRFNPSRGFSQSFQEVPVQFVHFVSFRHPFCSSFTDQRITVRYVV